MLEIYFETYGCTANYNSSEIMKGLLKSAGLNLTENVDFADFVVVNSCIVKEPTEEKIRRRVFDLLAEGKKVILAGCMPRLLREKLQHENLFLLDTSHVKDIINLIQDIRDGSYDEEKYLNSRKEIKLKLPKLPREKPIGITQISEGCLGNCSYCATRLAKGKLFSYPIEDVVENIRRDLESGCKEIWLTSQDCASYGNDSGKHLLPKLLKEILKIKKKFFVRVGMMNPNNVLKVLDELIEIYKDEKMFKFLHLPLQSGSDKILKDMNRFYSREDFMKIISKFKKEFPDMHISTDVIVGYSTESEKDFEETVGVVKEIYPETINVSKFWPREKTPAFKLKNLPNEVRSVRATKLLKLHKEICNEKQKKFVGKEFDVLVDSKGFPGTFLARDINYKLFAVQSRKNILGKKVRVKVKKVTPHYLISEESESATK